MQVSGTLRLIQASKHAHRLWFGLVIALCAVLLTSAPTISASLARWLAPVLPLPAFEALLASSLIMLAGLSGAVLVAEARQRAIEAERLLDAEASVLTHEPGQPALGDTRMDVLKQAVIPAGYPQFVTVLALSIAAAAAAWASLRTTLSADELAGPKSVSIGVGAVLLCFPLVVLERHLAGTPENELPEAAPLGGLLRVGICTLLGLGLAKVTAGAGYPWGAWALRAASLVCFLVAVELALRAIARCFLPLPAPDQMTGAATSSVAGLLRLSSPENVREAVRQRLGIDVAQSWALGFLRRAAMPSLCGLAIAAWLLTGVAALPLNERAVYERLGRPVRVLQPGLHLILPWPFGHLQRVELGILHDLPAGSARSLGAGTEPDGTGQSPVFASTAPPEESGSGADRLWDRPHPDEATYLIASATRDQPGFQVIDIDMRIAWLAGESDEDALNVVYSAESPERLIGQLAGRLLARRFASSTLSAVLVEDRVSFIQSFRGELQADLDQMHSGIHLAAIAIEAVHPPPQAAGAYHAVLASDIQARTSIAESRGSALQQESEARQAAQSTRDEAAVNAAEIVAQARSQTRFYAAEFTAWERDGGASLLEHRLERIARALPAAQTVIVDHHLSPEDVPTLDLRSLPAVP